jgi:hypothetical protein
LVKIDKTGFEGDCGATETDVHGRSSPDEKPDTT